MATTEEFDKISNEIEEILSEIVKLDIEKDLIRSDYLGSSLNFNVCRDVFEKIINITNEIKEGDWRQLPYSRLSSLLSQVTTVNNKLNEIKAFDPSTQSADRTNLINSVQTVYETYYTNVFEIISFVRLQTFKPSEAEKEIKNKLKSVQDISTDASAKLAEINDILSKSKQAAGETGVAKYASYFKDESGAHERVAKGWFWGVILMSAVVMGWGVVLLFWITKDLKTGDAIQYSIAKFVVLSALFYILVWVTKNYNANKHNYIVNRHRANSLNSFETFVKSTEDQGTKDAVLLQAAQSIFNPQATGYDNKDVDGDTSNKFIEILRHIEPKR